MRGLLLRASLSTVAGIGEAAVRIVRAVMKASGALLALLVLVACAQQIRLSDGAPLPEPHVDTLRVATLNVHYIDLRSGGEGPWSLAGWERRKAALGDTVAALKADVIAFQEMESFRGGDDDSDNLARGYLLGRLPGFEAAATGDWRSFPSTQPIFYRTDRLRLEDQGWFFFSEKPAVIYSRTFDGSWPAFASWAEFTPVGGGQRFRLVNVHLEYRSASNRRRSAELIARRLTAVIDAGTPVILAGDLNALRGWRVMRILQDAGLRFPRVPAATHHLNRGVHLLPAIDHIGLAGLDATGGPYVPQMRHGGVWPTDHHPVVLDLAP
ncbi:Metal-dependent hydrolase, endonuclease/exonuclease/phosphatase family [Salipiger thiooxidans]|uniref:Metal-dependent hydrolase, endonuclease/exonuclease/phosphatase family n=1 Tax=Salipiger thiooxidans TaxID=282683 RepID=A0A1G7BAI1_9RHOB|nr:Metal-dependent hydrolase, endonuclease/exonuclease/phosphatase family [Salipiger thiooxidans]